MFVFDIHGLQLGEAYSNPARMYVRCSDRCCSKNEPQSLVERHLIMFTLFFPLTTEFWMWEVNLKSLSVVIPRNLYSPTVSILVFPALNCGSHFLSEDELLNTIHCFGLSFIDFHLPSFRPGQDFVDFSLHEHSFATFDFPILHPCGGIVSK